MTNSDLNKDTNVPHRLRLGDVLGAIELSPGEISTFLSGLAQQFLGGAHHNMGLMLRDHAAMVANPETYGYKVADQATQPGVEPYTPPSTPAYAESFGGDKSESLAQRSGAPTNAEAVSGGTTTRASIPAHPTNLNPFLSPSSTVQATPPVSADLPSDLNAPGSGVDSEPSWMADARRAGWNPTRDDAAKAERDYEATATPPNATPGIYRAPAGPPVSEQYRAPYTRPASETPPA